jgi:sugar lactone lactonase YvrE
MTNERGTVLVKDLHFGEGPRWHDGLLWFSDFYDYAVKTVDADGRVTVRLSFPDRPSGLGWLPDGRMLVVSMTRRQLLRVDGTAIAVHADLSHIATWHCNDMVVDAHGRAYVGNFGFDLDTAEREGTLRAALEEHGGATLARVDPDGSVHAAATGLRFPNGMVITPDGRTLIVAETMGRRLTAFDIDADGSLANARTWADLGRRLPDGICLDAEGGIWVANAVAPECVRVVEGGEVTDAVTTNARCFACMLGGADGRSLFMMTAETSRSDLASVRRTGSVVVTEVAVPHAGLP